MSEDSGIEVFVDISNRFHFCQISAETHNLIRDGLAKRGQPIEFFLRRVVATYGELTEYNIRRFMREIWKF